jgi:hypothetical protein
MNPPIAMLALMCSGQSRRAISALSACVTFIHAIRIDADANEASCKISPTPLIDCSSLN